jgi:hypothetical protein
MQQTLKGVPEAYMDAPEGLTPISATDPEGHKPVRELIYKESLPDVGDAPAEAIPTQPPVPVSDARPKPVEHKN